MDDKLDDGKQPEALSLLQLPEEILERIARWCSIPSLGALIQTCRQWDSAVNKESSWKSRICRELTTQPKFTKWDETYKDYYERIYYGYGMMRSGYKDYLTKALIFVSPEEEANYNYSECRESSLTLNEALVSACAAGCEIWAKELIAKGANVNCKASEMNPLSAAVEAGHLHIIELLLAHGASINIFFLANYGREYQTVFHALLGSPLPSECLRKLRSSKEKIKILPWLHIAVLVNHLEWLTALLNDPRTEINKRDCAGVTALGWALLLKRGRCAKLLIERNASLSEIVPCSFTFFPRTLDGNYIYSPLFLIIYQKKSSLLALILMRDRDPLHNENKNFGSGWGSRSVTPLEWCVECKFPKGLEILLKYGTRNGLNEAVCAAAELDQADCLALLIPYKPNLNYKRRREEEDRKDRHTYIETPLTLATKRGNADCVKLLLMNGAQPNIASITKSSYKVSGIWEGPDVGVWEEQPDCLNTPLQNIVDYLISHTALASNYYCYSRHDRRDNERRAREWNEPLRAEFEREDYSPHDPKNRISFRVLSCIRALLEFRVDVAMTISGRWGGSSTVLSCLTSSIKEEKDLFTKNTNKLKRAAIEIVEHDATLKKISSVSPAMKRK